MQTFKKLLIPLLLIILIIIGWKLFNLGVSGLWRNNQIDSDLRSEINRLDRTIIQSARTNNPSMLKEIMSDVLKEKSGDNIQNILDQLGSVLKSDDYRILDQYYIKNSSSGISNFVMSGKSEVNDYVINYQALNDEMFVSLIIPKGGRDECLITGIYGKYPDGWKLNILQAGLYTINGKTAPELYIHAKEQYGKGYIINAVSDLILAYQELNPANNFWQYQKESELKQFNDTVMQELQRKYKFPYVMNTLQSKPQIINITPFGMNEGYFPMVGYITSISLDDTKSLKIENDAIHKEIGNVFKGLDKDKKYVFYKAFNEMPNGFTQAKTYGFVKEN